MPKVTGPAIAMALGCVALASPIFEFRAVLPWGFNIFFFWSAACIAAVLAGRMIIWAALVCSAFVFVSADWWMNGPPPINEYGFGPMDAIALFSATALVIAGTSVLAVVRTAVRFGGNGG